MTSTVDVHGSGIRHTLHARAPARSRPVRRPLATGGVDRGKARCLKGLTTNLTTRRSARRRREDDAAALRSAATSACKGGPLGAETPPIRGILPLNRRPIWHILRNYGVKSHAGTLKALGRARSPGTLFRAFEQLVRGQEPRNAIVMLCGICGQCGGAHSTAGTARPLPLRRRRRPGRRRDVASPRLLRRRRPTIRTAPHRGAGGVLLVRVRHEGGASLPGAGNAGAGRIGRVQLGEGAPL